ncbi:bi-domain-containing oxidoreductase [Gammaproteobacteria bacterium]|nr:bi-domain-containing oxidoreductase [Gammaproteobacteria bacterium]
MKQVLIKQGKAIVNDVPAPIMGDGEVLVQLRKSCLSVGTEINGVQSSGTPLWQKALQQPEKIATVIKSTSDIGFKRTWDLIAEKNEVSIPTGYSAAGVVIKVGHKVKNILPGDRVACAGAQCAFHAEFISVPENLCTIIPDNLDWESASTVTLGAIALQGIRRMQPSLGETIVVIGLGFLGILTIQLLKANGCKVIGIDIDRERLNLAMNLGIDVAVDPNSEDHLDQVARLTDGFGADGVIITAASSSDQIISSAFKLCRKKGRVVIVGDIGLSLNREDFYLKEIDVLISTSYGPGRYDNKYEDEGLDYPISYVRWTENRNMSEYIRLLSEGMVEIKSLISSTFSIDEASEAYNSILVESDSKPILVLLSYPNQDVEPVHRTLLKHSSKPINGKLNIAILGAGAHARSMHLPALKGLKDYFNLSAVVTKSGHKAKEIAEQFDASYASTDYLEVLSDKEIDAVIISTRHDLHGKMTLEALKAGKHVLVEKPLSLNSEEIGKIDEYIKSEKNEHIPILLTGYNRRFSPYALKIQELIKERTNPFIINYRMNAGYIPMDHWVHGPEGGGRNLGEACHIYDFFTSLTDSKIISVSANAIKPKTNHYSWSDNFISTLGFEDGSLCTLTYTALGNTKHPKELAEIYFDNKVITLKDYKSLETIGCNNASLKTKFEDKGMKQELIQFAKAIKKGDHWPIPWWQQLQVANIGVTIEEKIRKASKTTTEV